MALKTIDEQVADRFNPSSDTGRAFADRERAAADPLEDLYNQPAIAGRERIAGPPPTPSPVAATRGGVGAKVGAAAQKVIFRGKIKGKTSFAAILFVLLGGGSVLTFFMSPAMLPVFMKETLIEDLNDQLKAFDSRSATLLRSKFKDATNGSCGVVKVACRFATINDKMIEQYRAAGITVEVDKNYGFGDKRGRITSMQYTNPSTGVTTTVNDAAKLQSELRNNMAFRAAMIQAYNPKFISMSDTIARKVFAKNKASKTNKITGETDEERQKAINQSVEGRENLTAKNLTPILDEENKPTGDYTDENGNRYSAAEVAAANESAERISKLAEIGSTKFVQTAAKGVLITAPVDSACTLYNTSRAVAALSKVRKKEQAVRFATAMVLTPADASKAGAATEDMMNFVGNNLTEIITEREVVDESKWATEGSADNPPMTANPDYGKNALDSPGYRMAAYGDVPTLNTRAQRFMLGGGTTGTLDSVNQVVASVVNGGNPDPREVSAKCRYVQNPFVRGASAVIGILAGLGSGGASMAASIAGSFAIAMALPYLESVLADMVAGNLFKDLEGIDSGDAAFVGTAGLMGDMAMARGLKPLNAEEVVAYTAATKETYNYYAEAERYLARSTPLDITNRYSFLGSVAYAMTPQLQRANTSIATAATTLASAVPRALQMSTASATKEVTIERFKKCKDVGYQAIGIDADVFCNVRYGMSKEEMAMNPIDNAVWMAQTGNIDPNDEDGAAKDNGEEWNYVKFLKECVNRTHGWGEPQTENGEDGGNCTAAKYEPLNQRFRVYTADISADIAFDAEEPEPALPGTTGYSTGENGPVSPDGWAWPTTGDGEITSNFGMRGGSMHRGVDLTHNGGSMGKPIFAARDGKVIASGPMSGFGNWIVIQHEADGMRYDSLYGHMEDDGVFVRVGDTVKAGQQIGKIGNKGWSTGPHLHFELWKGGRSDVGGSGDAIDPKPILEAAKRSSAERSA